MFGHKKVQTEWQHTCNRCQHIWYAPAGKQKIERMPNRMELFGARASANGERMSFGRGLGKGELQLMNLEAQKARALAQREGPSCPACGSKSFVAVEVEI